MHKLAILVVFYKPNSSDLAVLDTLRDVGICTYIFDNTPDTDETAITPDAIDRSCFRLLHKGENIGLSRAYNQGFTQARADGFTHVLVLDQDTRITSDTLTFMQLALSKSPDVGMLNFSQHGNPDIQPDQEKMLVINSATVFNLTCHQIVHGFNETYFVDFVDYDYCWRCQNHKQSIRQVMGTPGLDHLSGQPDKEIHLFGKTIFARRYGRRRNMEILRGHFLLLGAGILNLRPRWVWIMLRSLALFFLGRIATLVTLSRSSKI